MEGEPDRGCVLQEADIAKEECLAQDHRDDAKIHRVADIAIQAFDNEMARWKDRSRSAQALQREACEGIEQHWDTQRDEENAKVANRRKTGEGWSKAPAGDPPGDETRDTSGSKDEKDGRAKKGEEPPQARASGG